MKTRAKKNRIWGKAVQKASRIFPENYFIQVSEYQIESGRIPSAFHGYRLVQLSDLHGCSFGKGNRRLIQKINGLAPDAIVMTGDMADRLDTDYSGLFGLLQNLCGNYPVYYILGNHEQEKTGAKRREFLCGLQRQGVKLLDNSAADIQKDGERIQLYGVRIPMKYYKKRNTAVLPAETIEKLIGACDRRHYSILLAHNPFCFESYAEWGADLIFSGHVHGGMIRLPLLGGLLSPERRFFPKYSGGCFRSDRFAGKMIVSRGLGSGARILNPPEIVAVTLLHSQECDR